MARYICPSCGAGFNGQKCKKCQYEAFRGQDAYSFHTHKGEAEATDTPRQTFQKQASRQKSTPGKPNTIARWFAWVIIGIMILRFAVALVSTLGHLAAGGITPFVSDSVQETEAGAQTAQVLCSEGNITVSIGQLDTLGDGALPVYIQNDSSRDVKVTIRDVMIGDFLAEDVQLESQAWANYERKDCLQLNTENLELAGIREIRELSCNIRIYDKETFQTVYAGTVAAQFAEDTAAPAAAFEPDGLLVAQADGVRVFYLGFVPSGDSPDDIMSGRFLFYLENNTDQALTIYDEEIRMNGGHGDIDLLCKLPPRTRTVCGVRLCHAWRPETLRVGDLTMWAHLQILDAAAPANVIDLEPFTVDIQ